MAINSDIPVDQLPNVGAITLADKLLGSTLNPATGLYETANFFIPGLASFLTSTLDVAKVAPNPTAGNLAAVDASGNPVDAGVTVGYDGTSNTIPTSAQVDQEVTRRLLNQPSLPPVNAATTANDALTGLAARDGYTPVAGDFILVKNQTISGNNGIYRAASTAWVRQKIVNGAYADISGDTFFDTLGIDRGIVDVLNGTSGRNTQWQIRVENPMIAFASTRCYVTSQTAKPVGDGGNVYANSFVGNDSNNGSQAFPVGSLPRAINLMTSTPAVINLMGNSSFGGSINWTQVNTTIQGANQIKNGGQQTITGQQVFAANSRYNHFKNTNHNTGAAAPFSFASGALCSNILENITINTSASDWLGLNAGCRNYIQLDNIAFGAGVNTAINLPAFTNAFGIWVERQETFKGAIVLNGTGAANTTVYVGAGVAEGNVRVSNGFLGTIFHQAPFTQRLGSFSHPIGVITSQADLSAVLAHTATTAYDGFYVISGFNPTSFSRGTIIGKQTFPAFGATSVWYARQFASAPGLAQDLAGNVYQASTLTPTTGDYVPLQVTATIPAGSVGNAELAATGAADGVYGDFDKVPQITLVKGRIDSVSQVAIPLPPTMGGATAGANGTEGLVPAPGAGDETRVLSGAGLWVVPAAQVTDVIGATASAPGAAGLVPAPAAGDQTKFLRGDGVFADATAQVAQYAKFTCVPQTSQPISVGYRIVFNSTEARTGTDITLTNGGNQININPSVPGTLYKVRSSHGIAYASGGPALVQSSILEIASQTYQGSKSITTAPSKVNNIAYNADGAECTITANSLIAVTLMITYNEFGSVLGYDASQGTDQQPWIEIEANTAPFVVPTDSSKAGVVANQATVVSLDNLRARWNQNGPGISLEIAAISGSANMSWTTRALLNDVIYNRYGEQTITTTWLNVSPGDTARTAGDRVETLVTDKSTGHLYRVTGMVTSAYTPVPIAIERLV